MIRCSPRWIPIETPFYVKSSTATCLFFQRRLPVLCELYIIYTHTSRHFTKNNTKRYTYALRNQSLCGLDTRNVVHLFIFLKTQPLIKQLRLSSNFIVSLFRMAHGRIHLYLQEKWKAFVHLSQYKHRASDRVVLWRGGPPGIRTHTLILCEESCIPL